MMGCMTSTDTASAGWYTPIHDTLHRVFTIEDCPTCGADRDFDDPAECPTCAGERTVVTGSRLVIA